MTYPLTYPFGRDKGKALTEVNDNSLQFLIDKCSEPCDPKYKAKNDALKKAAIDIINARTDAQVYKGKAASTATQYQKTAVQEGTKQGPSAQMIWADIKIIKSELAKIRQTIETSLGNVRNEPLDEGIESARQLFGAQETEGSPF